MNVWIFHHYATLPNLNGYLRPYYFAQYLIKEGIKITIFAASYQHFSDTDLISDNSKFKIVDDFGTPFVFVRTPSSKKNGFSRIKNMTAYCFRLFGVTRHCSKSRGVPDLVYASSPHPLALIAGIKIAKRYHVPCICEIRDLWPEAIFKTSRLKASNGIGKLLVSGEHWIYKHADSLVFTKEGDTDYLKEQKWLITEGGDIDSEKCFYINNGVDIDSFYQQIEDCELDDPDLAQDEKFRVVYTGAVRKINHVGNILDAAEYLRDKKDIEFLIYGDGNEVEGLKRRIADEKLMNVKIKGFVEKKYIPFILSRSSVNLLNYSQSKYNWTRGNSSNKLFEYMASGRPVISTVKMGYSIIGKYKCGIELEKDTPRALADAILRVRRMPQSEYDRLCKNAQKGARDFDYKLLSEKLLYVMTNLVEGTTSG